MSNIERGRKTLKFCRKISKTKCSSMLYLFMGVGTSEVAASPVFLADIVFIDEKKKKWRFSLLNFCGFHNELRTTQTKDNSPHLKL